MQVKEDEVVKAVRWKLGIPVDNNDGRAREIWEGLQKDPHKRGELDRVARFLSDLMEMVVRSRLDLPARGASPEDAEFVDALWSFFARWLEEAPMKRSPRINGLIKEAFSGKKTTSALVQRTPPSTPASAAARPPQQPPRAAPTLPVAEAPLPSQPTVDSQLTSKSNPARPAGTAWLYYPVPENELDPHTESYGLRLAIPDGGELLGARVRGKKHKHEGTNCDDWFEVRTKGPWTVIAVADGAGSRKFSRLGARSSCGAGTEALIGFLDDYPDGLAQRDRNSAIEFVKRCLRQAIRAAADAVERKAEDCMGSPERERMLGRPLTVEDLSATLLLAVHTFVPGDDGECSLVVACQIGDGIIAAVEPNGVVRLLGQPDSGDYSGETDFLTSRRQREPANLERKTFHYFGPLRAVLAMTDGVADDYFPADPGMAHLYADLVLNGILPAGGHDADTQAELDLSDGQCDSEAEALTAEGPLRVVLRSAARYASALGMQPAQLAAMPHRLRAGAEQTPLARQAASPEERLRLWLDAYQVRGSFDDRTLVVFHRAEGR